MTVEIGDRYRHSRNPGIVYEVVALHSKYAWLKLIEHPCDVCEDDYYHESSAALEGSRYEKVEPFFEIGKKYRYVGGDWVWHVKAVEGHKNVRVALACRISEAGNVFWRALENFDGYEEVSD